MASSLAGRKPIRSARKTDEPHAAGATAVTFTPTELVAVFDALVRAGAETRPAGGAINAGLTPARAVRHAAAVDSARRRVSVALAESGAF